MQKGFLVAVLWALSFVLSPAQERKEGSLYECDMEVENSITILSVQSRATGIGTRHLFVPEQLFFFDTHLAFFIGLKYRYCEYVPKVTVTGFENGFELSPSSFQDHQLVGSFGFQIRFDNIRKLRKSIQPYLCFESIIPVINRQKVLAISGIVELNDEQIYITNERTLEHGGVVTEVGAAFTVGRWGQFHIGLGIDYPLGHSQSVSFDIVQAETRLAPMVFLKIGKRFDVWRFKSDNGGRMDVRIYGE